VAARTDAVAAADTMVVRSVEYVATAVVVMAM
jgi:hypothetical protein